MVIVMIKGNIETGRKKQNEMLRWRKARLKSHEIESLEKTS
jgi:hypothetical protein